MSCFCVDSSEQWTIGKFNRFLKSCKILKGMMRHHPVVVICCCHQHCRKFFDIWYIMRGTDFIKSLKIFFVFWWAIIRNPCMTLIYKNTPIKGLLFTDCIFVKSKSIHHSASRNSRRKQIWSLYTACKNKLYGTSGNRTIFAIFLGLQSWRKRRNWANFRTFRKYFWTKCLLEADSGTLDATSATPVTNWLPPTG